jgi:glycosyltransferase involved in cell wall biosynthesis
MNISYAITVCNERNEIEKLVSFLIENKQPDDEIVVLFDTNNGTEEVESFLDTISPHISLRKSPFNFHFADWKNRLNSYCKKDYIFQIDADELPAQDLMDSLHSIIEQGVDVILVPRENTVEGLTEQHIKKWGWRVDGMNRVNWPDYQWRLYRNDPSIKWINKVHERLDGYKTFSSLPPGIEYGMLFLHHPKTIERQERQNNFYNTLT